MMQVSKRFRLGTAIVVGLLMSGCAEPVVDDSYSGYVEVEWLYIATPQSGWLVSRPVREGTQIAVGDVLFELDKEQQLAAVSEATGRVAQSDAQARDISIGARPAEIRELQARLDEARAQMEQARLEQDRILPLVAQGLEPKTRGDVVVANYTAAVARVKASTESIEVARQAGRAAAQEAAAAVITAAEAARTAAQWQLDQRTAIARVGGRTEAVFHYPGEYVTAGTPIIAMRPENALKLRFFVPQADLSQLSIGQSVQVKADGLAAPVNATVSFIATTAEFTPPVIYSVGSREKLVFMVEARLSDSSQLHPGLPVDVSRL